MERSIFETAKELGDHTSPTDLARSESCGESTVTSPGR